MESAWKYPSDLSDEQWRIIKRLLPKPAQRGRKPIDRRRIIDAILYRSAAAAANGGCCRETFRTGARSTGSFAAGDWMGYGKRFTTRCGSKCGSSEGKKPTPTVAIIDSQSMRTAEGGEERGYDAGKKITGRKRHLAVDTLGFAVGRCRPWRLTGKITMELALC